MCLFPWHLNYCARRSKPTLTTTGEQRELEILKHELEARVAERTIELEASMTGLALSEERYRMLVDNANDIALHPRL